MAAAATEAFINEIARDAAVEVKRNKQPDNVKRAAAVGFPQWGCSSLRCARSTELTPFRGVATGTECAFRDY